MILGIKLTPDQFVIRRIGNEIALFNTHSGRTHLLDPSLAAVFDLLDDTPKIKTTVVAEIEANRNMGLFQDNIENFVDHALCELQDIGLIEITELS